MTLDKSLDLLKSERFLRLKAVMKNMTKICMLFTTVFIGIEFFMGHATASQNVMIASDNREAVSGAETPDTPAATDSTSKFKISTGGSEGTGRGGQKLLEIKSTETMSFFPRDLALSEVMVEKMNQVFGLCVQDAATNAGLGTVSQINVSHPSGGYSNRRINNGSRRANRPWSMHSTGRAFDISRIDVTANGKKYNIPMTKKTNDGKNGQAQSKFYKAFNSCWKKHNISTCNGRKVKSVLDCHFNYLHHDHVHIAVPFCPRKSGIATT